MDGVVVRQLPAPLSTPPPGTPFLRKENHRFPGHTVFQDDSQACCCYTPASKGGAPNLTKNRRRESGAMRARRGLRWLNLVVVCLLVFTGVPGFTSGGNHTAPTQTVSQAILSNPADPRGVEAGTDGGIVDLPGGVELILPPNALSAKSRISRYTVEMRLANGLPRYHPITPAIHVEARRSDDGSPVGQLQRRATVRFRLDRPEIPQERLGRPAIRIRRL